MQEENYHQEWRHAGITNDFIFGNVMQMGDNCLNLLRAILPELHLQKVKFINTQKEIRTDYQRKGVRLDLFAEDAQHRVYDVEMQVKKKPTVGKRVRYYQSKIDADVLQSGEDVDRIKPSYIIFLMPNDQFGFKRRRYTFHYYCDEEPGLKLETASNLIFLNSKGLSGKVSDDLQDFFTLMNDEGPSSGQFIQTIYKDIQRVKADPEREREFMDFAMKMHDAQQEGIQQGKLEGRIESATKTAQEFKKLGLDASEITQKLSDIFEDKLSLDQIDQIVSQLK